MGTVYSIRDRLTRTLVKDMYCDCSSTKTSQGGTVPKMGLQQTIKQNCVFVCTLKDTKLCVVLGEVFFIERTFMICCGILTVFEA